MFFKKEIAFCCKAAYKQMNFNDLFVSKMMPQETITFSFFYHTIKMKMAKQRGLKVTRGLRFLSFRFFIMMWRLYNVCYVCIFFTYYATHACTFH